MFIPENIKYNNYNLQFLRSYSKPHREWGGLIWGHIDIIQTYILKFIYTSRIKKTINEKYKSLSIKIHNKYTKIMQKKTKTVFKNDTVKLQIGIITYINSIQHINVI